MPNRSGPQCREKWFNCLDPAISHDKWTPQEDALLEAAIQKHGKGNWSAVAKDVPRRTDSQCRKRHMGQPGQ